MPRRNTRPRTTLAPTAPCPCGRDASYGDCCGSFHRGAARAPTAERLMRSRYSAFVVQDAAYLLRTWQAATRPTALDFDSELRWTGLDILGTSGGSAFHTEGTVEFRAHFSTGGQADSQHELSRFVREAGQWVYLDADPSASAASA